MADALGLGPSGEIRGGSSPFSRTKFSASVPDGDFLEQESPSLRLRHKPIAIGAGSLNHRTSTRRLFFSRRVRKVLRKASYRGASPPSETPPSSKRMTRNLHVE